MKKTAYICGTSLAHDLDKKNIGDIRIYGSVRALKMNESCWNECGIVKIEITKVQRKRNDRA